MGEIKLTVTDIREDNRRQKYLSAVSALAKAMKVPILVRPKIGEDHQEKYPYQAYKELVQKWVYFYAGVLDRIYRTLCHALDLPVVSTFSKATDTGPLIYKGKVLYSPETGKPITQKQWRELIDSIEKFLNRKMQEPEKKIVLEASNLGRLLDRMLKYNTWEAIQKMKLNEIKYKRHAWDWLTADEKNAARTFGLDEYDLSRLHVAKDSAAQYVRAMTDKSKNAVRQVIVNGIKERKSKGEIAQDLFDQLGSLNRDWQRIVETEVGDNLNMGFLLSQKSNAEPGEKVYFQRYEVLDDATCKHCQKINMLIALWSDVALMDEHIDDPYAKVAIWDGKTRVGRKANDDWVAAGVQHCYCRGSWARWYPPAEKTTSMYDAAMAKLAGKQRAWGKAVEQARAEFVAQGIANPDDSTPGYLDRINEIYRGIIGEAD
jgi:hypothetical protein